MKLKESVINTFICLGLVAISMQTMAQNAINTVETVPLTVPVGSDTGHKVTDWALDSLGKVAPPPLSFGISLFKALIPWPGQDETQTLTYKKLEEIEAKVDMNIAISLQTQNDISKLASNIYEIFYNQQVSEQKEVIRLIDQKYDNFYLAGLLPNENNNFYAYAESVCKGGVCSDTERQGVLVLDGQVPETATRLLAGNMYTNNLYELQNYYSISLKNKDAWSGLQTLYNDRVNQTDNTMSDKLVPLMAANQALFGIQVDYYSGYVKLYNMLDMQLAFYYAHPEFFKGKGHDTQFIPGLFNGVDKTGQEGYFQARNNLDSYFLKEISPNLDQVFKGGTSGAAWIKVLTGTQYVNNYFKKIGASSLVDNKDILVDSSYCQPVSLIMPNDTKDVKVGRLTSRCQTDNFDNNPKLPTSYNLKGIDIPYQVESTDKLKFFGYKKITYNTKRKQYEIENFGKVYPDTKVPIYETSDHGFINTDRISIEYPVKAQYADIYVHSTNNVYVIPGFSSNNNGHDDADSVSAIEYHTGEHDIYAHKIPEETFGYNAKILLEGIKSTQLHDKDVHWGNQYDGYIYFALTQDGHLFGINAYFSDHNGSADGVKYSCYANSDSCQDVFISTNLVWSDGSILAGFNQNGWNDEYPYMDFLAYNLKVLPNYVAPQDYLSWQKDGSFENKVYLDGSLTLGGNDQVLLIREVGDKSTNRHTIRLIYIAPKKELSSSGDVITTTSAYLDIQSKNLKDEWVKVHPSEYFTSSNELFDGELSGIELTGGDIQMLQNTNQSTDSVVWSIQELYQHKDAHWNANPYAWIELSEEGHLVIKGSQLDSNDKPIDIVIWNGKKDPASDKLDPTIRGTYVQSCSDIHWDYTDLSANCGGSEVKIDYYHDCAELSTVSFNGSKLVCDTAAHW